MELVDTHTHIYLEDFKDDIAEIITSAKAAGVKRFYLPAIDSSAINQILELESKYPGICIPMTGLHPCSVKENFEEELAIVAKWLQKRSFVAIGEIGLDFYWDKTFTTQQFAAFNYQMELALQYQLPIVIHTRNAMTETIDAVRPFANKGLRGIFHCFGGTKQEAEEIINMGFYLGIGGVLTYKKSGLAEVMAEVSLEHVVLETDSPYLTPVPFRGKRNESKHIHLIAEKLAEIKGILLEEVAGITTANANKIFNFTL